MHCAFCRRELQYVHGHAACLEGRCPMFGVNQAECCSGETAACGPLTAELRGAPPNVDPSPDRAEPCGEEQGEGLPE